ncbi:hypothetical protein DPMN_188196 [Dreissena polymorpha]|uniref:Uncharacterized protein n=1 Tax=Dreissena polymorpha TaxID=45954 RepID=A0A9D4DRM4_DREPO|nr:hypothetical protein DPMN_188196 [Dreissena polymorpha]
MFTCELCWFDCRYSDLVRSRYSPYGYGVRLSCAAREPSYPSLRNWKLQGALSCCTAVR